MEVDWQDDCVIQELEEEMEMMQVGGEFVEWVEDENEDEDDDGPSDIDYEEVNEEIHELWQEQDWFQQIEKCSSESTSPPKHQKQDRPQFEATVYMPMTYEQGLALHNQEKQDHMVFTHRLKQGCFLYRYTLQNNVFLEFVSQQETKYGLIPQENAEILMHIKLVESLQDKAKKFYCVEPQKVSIEEERHLRCSKFDKKVYKNIRNKRFDQSLVHKLQRDDEIRFGLETFKITEVQSYNELSQLRQEFQPKPNNKSEYVQQQLVEGTCKICLSSENQPENPLLDPCQCKGTCQYVHLECLKTWLDSHLEKYPTPPIDTYKWLKFQCEICKKSYPATIKYKGKYLHLASYKIPNKPYIVFERMRHGSRKQIIVIKAGQSSIFVGRMPYCHFQIALNSVSRDHATIEYKQGNFYIRDLESKYGTLVRIKDQIRVQGKLKVQVGDVLIRFDVVVNKHGKEYVWKRD